MNDETPGLVDRRLLMAALADAAREETIVADLCQELSRAEGEAETAKAEIDRLAARVAELEGLLRRGHGAIDWGGDAALLRDVEAALRGAGEEGAASDDR